MLIADFADAEGVEHVELSGLERGPVPDSGASSSVTVSLKLASYADGPIRLGTNGSESGAAARVSLSHRRRGFAASSLGAASRERGRKRFIIA